MTLLSELLDTHPTAIKCGCEYTYTFGVHVFVCFCATEIQCQIRCVGLPKADLVEY